MGGHRVVGASRGGDRFVTAASAIFLDRDGVINELVLDRASGRHESPYAAADVRLAAGAVDGLHVLARLGVPVVVVSNQPAAAKGTATREQLRGVHDEIERLLRSEGIAIDDYRYCFHHPDGLDAELGVRCTCRKPAPGMVITAASELGVADLSASWLIGDSDVDVLAGRSAGCRTILVEDPASRHRRSGVEADARAPDLAAAANVVLRSAQAVD
jgi:D-glycero-D-manno-heptose 1,7-bisphosphate phosphatase